MIETTRASLCGAALCARRDGDYNVWTLFVVDTIHVEKDYAFVDAELGALTCGKNHGVLCVPRANVEYDAVRFKDVLYARSLG
jgi:hypothetical protein